MDTHHQPAAAASLLESLPNGKLPPETRSWFLGVAIKMPPGNLKIKGKSAVSAHSGRKEERQKRSEV
jgi:hypothetical protein